MSEDREAALHRLNPTERFSGRASDYVKYRPSYPAAAIDAILRGLGEPGSLVAADVGAGTGISARLLSARGVRVIAVEPNEAMRAEAVPDPHVEWRAGTAEATGLATSSVDLVISAQAFHWFRQREAIAEFHRILRPGGRLALMWNSRDRRDVVTRCYIEAVDAAKVEHLPEHPEIDSGVIDGAGLFTVPRRERHANEHFLDREGLIGRATSDSNVHREGPAFEILRASLNALFDRYRDPSGRVRMQYVTKVHLANRLDPDS